MLKTLSWIKVRQSCLTTCLIFLGWQIAARADFQYDEINELKNGGGDQFECVFLGDTYFGEVYQEDYRAKGRASLDLSQVAEYYRSIHHFSDFLQSADMSIANLASAITNLKESPLEGMGKEYIHKAHVLNTPEVLKNKGIRAVSLGNNHALDYGTQGLNQTVKLLNKAGIKSFGAGKNINKALKPYFFKVPFQNGREFKVAVIGGLELRRRYLSDQYDFYAGPDKPGVAPLSIDRIKALVANLRKEDPNLFIILFPHWGRDYEVIDEAQDFLAKHLRNSGINAVIGHGSHLAHRIEVKNNQLIAYSLGNFVFNTHGRYEEKFVEAYSLVARMSRAADSNEVIFRFYPIFGDNRQVNFEPRFAQISEFDKVGRNLHMISEEKNYQKSLKKLRKHRNHRNKLNLPSPLSNRNAVLGRDAYGWYYEFKVQHSMD